jgi:hypothetical protein
MSANNFATSEGRTEENDPVMYFQMQSWHNLFVEALSAQLKN